MFSENVQKNKVNNIEEGQNMKRKVNYVGVTREGILAVPRYKNLLEIFDYFEDMLDEPLYFDVKIDYVVLHAMFLAATPLHELEDDPNCKIVDVESTIEQFEVLEPINFFRLLNDLSVQNIAYNSEDIYDKFLRNIKILKSLNKFYNEYSDIYDINLKFNYTSLYLFGVLSDKNISHPSLDNFFKHIHNDDRQIRHFICRLLNEFYNEKERHNASERLQSECWYNIYRINKKLDDVLNDNKIDKAKYISVDSLADYVNSKVA